MGRTVTLGAMALALCMPAIGAHAARLDVVVTDARSGAPVEAVVTLVPQAGTPAAAPAAAGAQAKVIDQKDLAYVPYIETFRTGDRVSFHNSDRTRHHVYSFSPIRPFELVLGPGESSPPMVLDRSGVIAVGCNIHDQMATYLYVSDAPWIARTGTRGVASFERLPAGRFEVRVWQPRLRPKQPDLVRQLVSLADSDARSLRFRLSLLPDPRFKFDRERTRY